MVELLETQPDYFIFAPAFEEGAYSPPKIDIQCINFKFSKVL